MKYHFPWESIYLHGIIADNIISLKD